MLSCINKEKIFTAFTHFQVIFSIFSGKNSTLKYLKKYDWNFKNLNVWIDSWWAPVGSGSGFLNPELLDPDPAENGQAPQPWIKVQLAAPDPPLREWSGTHPRPSRSRRSPAPFFLQRDTLFSVQFTIRLYSENHRIKIVIAIVVISEKTHHLLARKKKFLFFVMRFQKK